MNGHSERPASAKVVLIGDSGTGKTALRGRWLYDSFSQQYKTTIGADFYSKTLQTDDGAVSLACWDTAGQERFRSLGAAFYRGSDAVVMVFSVIDRKSLKNIATWFSEFKARAPVEEGRESEMTWVCIANKVDLSQTAEDAVSKEEAQTLLDSLLAPSSKSDGETTPTAPEIPEELSIPPHYSTSDTIKQNDHRPLSSIDVPEKRSRLNSLRSIDINPRHSSMTTTGDTIYHTPSSSSYSTSQDTIHLPGALRETIDVQEIFDEPEDDMRPLSPLPPLPEQSSGSSIKGKEREKPYDGIKLFLSSAKSGQNISEPFEYIAQHIMARLKEKERKSADGNEGDEESVLDNVKGGGSTAVKVGDPPGAIQKGWRGCC